MCQKFLLNTREFYWFFFYIQNILGILMAPVFMFFLVNYLTVVLTKGNVSDRMRVFAFRAMCCLCLICVLQVMKSVSRCYKNSQLWSYIRKSASVHFRFYSEGCPNDNDWGYTYTDLSVNFTGAVLGETEVGKFCVTKCTYCIIYCVEKNRILKCTCGYKNSSTWVL
jgi:hypothetical protein